MDKAKRLPSKQTSLLCTNWLLKGQNALLTTQTKKAKIIVVYFFWGGRGGGYAVTHFTLRIPNSDRTARGDGDGSWIGG